MPFIHVCIWVYVCLCGCESLIKIWLQVVKFTDPKYTVQGVLKCVYLGNQYVDQGPEWFSLYEVYLCSLPVKAWLPELFFIRFLWFSVKSYSKKLLEPKMLWIFTSINLINSKLLLLIFEYKILNIKL